MEQRNSTNGQELSKSPIRECSQRYDSGADDQGDVSSHVDDMIAYESNEISSPSIEISSSNDSVFTPNKTEDESKEHDIEVEVVAPRRSARNRKPASLT